jgi:hypothetical protein
MLPMYRFVSGRATPERGIMRHGELLRERSGAHAEDCPSWRAEERRDTVQEDGREAPGNPTGPCVAQAREAFGWIAQTRLALSVLWPREQHQAARVRRMRQDSGERADDDGRPAGAGGGAPHSGDPQEVRAVVRCHRVRVAQLQKLRPRRPSVAPRHSCNNATRSVPGHQGRRAPGGRRKYCK